MRDTRVAAVQFECRDADKACDFPRIADLTRKAVEQGAETVSVHEMRIPAYAWPCSLSVDELARVAEPVPDDPSTVAFIAIARDYTRPS